MVNRCNRGHRCSFFILCGRNWRDNTVCGDLYGDDAIPRITLIRDGNTAAAISLGGAILGYTYPLAQAVAQSGGLADLLIWSAVALIAQFVAFAATRLALPHLSSDVKEGKMAPAVLLATVSIAIGMLNAAAMTE